MPFVQNISGSSNWSLGVGSDFKVSWHYIAIETGSGFTGNVTVLKRTAGQPTPIPVVYQNSTNGNYQSGPITGSVSLIIESTNGEIILSSSIGAGSASVFYNFAGGA